MRDERAEVVGWVEKFPGAGSKRGHFCRFTLFVAVFVTVGHYGYNTITREPEVALFFRVRQHAAHCDDDLCP